MRTYIFITLALLAAALAACGGDGGASDAPTPAPEPQASATIEVASEKPVVIGVSVALSGDQQNIGNDLAVAAQMAVDDYGSILGDHFITLSIRDDACTDPGSAVDVANLFSADPSLIGVVGPMCTVGAQAANPLYEEAGVIHIAPVSTRDELSQQGDEFFFRTAWHDSAQAMLQARYLFEDLGGATAVVVDDSEPYGVGLADAFEAAYTDAGGEVIERYRIERGDTDFSGLTRQVLAAAPAAVVFEGLNPEGALVVKALREAGYAGTFMGPDGLLSVRDFIPTAGTAAEGAVLTGGPVADAGFTARFEERTQRLPATPFVLQAYDAVTALLRAAEATLVDGGDGTLTIDRAVLAEAMRNGRFAGLTGSITFDDFGDRRGETAPELGLRVYRIENAGLVLVE